MATSPSPGIPLRQHPSLGWGSGASPGIEVLVGPISLGTITASTTWVIPVTDGSQFDFLGYSVVATGTDAVASGDNLAIDVQDAGSAGSGTTSMFSSVPDYATATGGLDFSVANVPSEAQADQNNQGLGHALKIVVTMTGTVNLAGVYITLRVRIGGAGK